jgi:hypothetical protein
MIQLGGKFVKYSHCVWDTHVLVKFIKMCLNKTYSKVCTGKHSSDMFTIQNGLKYGDALLPLHFNFTLPLGRSKKTR